MKIDGYSILKCVDGGFLVTSWADLRQGPISFAGELSACLAYIEAKLSGRKTETDIDAERIEDLELSVRTRNCMKNLGVETIGQLCSMTADELMKTEAFGIKSMNEVVALLAERGRTLKAADV